MRPSLGLIPLAAIGTAILAPAAQAQVTVIDVIRDLQASAGFRPTGGDRTTDSDEQTLFGGDAFSGTADAALTTPGGATMRCDVQQITFAEPSFIAGLLQCEIDGPVDAGPEGALDAAAFTQFFASLEVRVPTRLSYTTVAFDAAGGGFSAEILDPNTGDFTLFDCFGPNCPIEVMLEPGEWWILSNASADTLGGPGTCFCDARAELLFEIRLEPTIPCELAGEVDSIAIDDLLAYLDLWFANAPGAERTGDGPADIGIADLLEFLDCWLSRR